MFPPKKSPYPWENIDPGGMALPGPGIGVSPPLQGTPNYTGPQIDPGGLALPAPVKPQQPIDNGGLALPAPVANATSNPGLQGNPSGFMNPFNNTSLSGTDATGATIPPEVMRAISGNQGYSQFRAENPNTPLSLRDYSMMYNESQSGSGYDATGRAGYLARNPNIPNAIAPPPPPPTGDTIPGGTPPPTYTNPSMIPGGNMNIPPPSGITRPTGGVMPGPKNMNPGGAGGNMNVPPLSGQLPRSGVFQPARKRVPNYVGM